MAQTRSKSVAENISSLNQRYAQIATDYYHSSYTIIDQIKTMRDKGKPKGLVRADGYQVYEYNNVELLKKMDDASGFENWKVENDDAIIDIHHNPNTTAYSLEFIMLNPKSDSVGTNGTTIVKILEEDDYDYLKTEDLAGPGLEMFDALHFSDIVNKYFPNDSETRELFQQWLDDRFTQYRKDIFEQCEIDMTEVTRLRSEEKYDELDKYFDDRIKIASGLNDTLLAELADSLRALAPKNLTIPFRKVVNDIKQAGINNLIKKGRPNIIKFKTIGKDGNKVKMMSAQLTQGEITLPSSSRHRKLGDKKLLSNHVNDVTGLIVETINGPQVIVNTTVTGHSSNPPIKENDELKRRYLAYLSVEEEVIQHLTNMTQSMKSMDDIGDQITIPISTIMMLTPLKHKKMEKVRGSTSENAQLGDTFLAYQMMAYNQPIKRKITINGQEKEISVYVDLSMMNMPVNVSTITNRALRSNLQQRINIKGFNKYTRDISNYFKNNQDSFRTKVTTELKKQNVSESEINNIFYHLIKKMDAYYDAINSDVITEISDSLQKLKEDNNGDLQKHYQAMTKNLKIYTETDSSDAKKAYENARDEIKKIESKIDQKEQELHVAKQAMFLQIENNEYKELHDGIDNVLKRVENISDPSIREYLLLQKRYLLAQQLFYKEEYLDTKNAYRFHVLYLLTNEEINRFITAFCKSGKDRTGWLRVALLASMAFYHAYGRDADFNNPKEIEDYNRYYAATAMELSASLDATAQNGGGRGFQIGADFTNTYINAASGKYSGSLTKAPYKNVLNLLTNITTNNVFNLEKAREKHQKQIPKADIIVHTNSEKTPIKTERPDFSYSINQVHNLIKFLREAEFDYSIQKNGIGYLVRDNREHSKFRPVPTNEAQVQALRYLQGMLIIHENLSDPVQSNFLEAVKANYEYFLNIVGQPPKHSAEHTEMLCQKFSNTIEKILNVTKGDKQLTMARDLGILLEYHPGVCTISKLDTGITVETSTPVKVSDPYYEKHFSNISSQTWFKNAKKMAGFSTDESNTWLEQFFINNYDDLKLRGVPATPSSRWLPLPANNQHISNQIIRPNKEGTLSVSESSFVRMGIVSAYDIDGTNERKELARDQIREIILSQIEARIKNYQELYGDAIDDDHLDFYINYQTLLTPHKKEAKIPYKDNNARFVEMAKEVVNELKDDDQFLNEIKNKYGFNLKFYQTNSSINHRGDWITAKDFAEDAIIRQEKILAARSWEPLLSDNISNELRNEIERRIAASHALQKLLNNESPFSQLNPYQRNIMMAALEFHTSGSQCLTLAGCKSARDRTALFAAAVKVMQENKSAMMNWEILNNGIILSLQQGHHFRSLINHSAVVKVSDVHKSFMEGLPIDIQHDIRNLKVFSKMISTTTQKEFQENWEQIQSRVDRYDEKIKRLTSTVLTKEQRTQLTELKTNCEALRNQLDKAEKRFQNDFPDQPKNTDYEQCINKLNQMVEKKGSIVMQSYPRTTFINEGGKIEEQVQAIIHNNDIVNAQNGQLKQVNDDLSQPNPTRNQEKLIHSCNKYIVGSHLITTVAVTSDNGCTRSIYFDEKNIKYLMGKNHFRNRNQDAKLKLTFEAISQIESFREQYVNGIIENLRNEGWSQDRINREGKNMVAQKLNSLIIEIEGLPPKMAKKMATYCTLMGYSHRTLVRGKDGKFINIKSQDTEEMKNLIEQNKELLPLAFDIDNAYKNNEKLTRSRTFLGDMINDRGKTAKDALLNHGHKPIRSS